VQEAAYSLIPTQARAETHLHIGRLLLAHTPPVMREESVFEIVNQLNRGARLLASREDRQQAAELNLLAGVRAKTSTAYASALNYFMAGSVLLPDDIWQSAHWLIFSLELHRGECEFLTGDLTAAEGRLSRLSNRAENTLERVKLTCLRADLYTALDQGERAVAVCLDFLRHVGIDWSPHPTEAELRREYERIFSQLGSRTIEELIELPLMRGATATATLDVLIKVFPPAWFTDANLVSLVICKAVNLTLKYGNSDGSCVAYAWLGMVAGPQFDNYDAAFRFGQLGYELVEQRGLRRFEASTYLSFAIFVACWLRHVGASRDLVHRAFEVANRNGDVTYAAYACNNLNSHLLFAGDPLVEVQREAERGLAFARKARFGLITDVIATQLGLIRTLRGSTPKFGCFDDDEFDELRIEHRFTSNKGLAFAESWYWIRKAQARFFAGDYAAATDASTRAERMLWASRFHLEEADHHFYGALSWAASCTTAPLDERQYHLAALATHRKQLEIWANNCPENFENRAALVGAEFARIEGRDLDAMRLYEQAIRSARANGFSHNEAIAYERASEFYRARGFDQIADIYLRDARYGYVRWGANGKVRPARGDVSAPARGRARARPHEHDRDAGGTSRPRHSDQGVAGHLR
jgi:hypothetical protein